MGDIPTNLQPQWRSYNDTFKQIYGEPDYYNDTRYDYAKWFEFKFNGRTFKYVVKVIGNNRPAGGFPLYIGLHGGGSGNPNDNDGYWWGMVTHEYAISVPRFTKQAVYVAVRGVS